MNLISLYLYRLFNLPMYLILRFIHLRIALAMFQRAAGVLQDALDSGADEKVLKAVTDDLEVASEYLASLDERLSSLWYMPGAANPH